MAENPSQGLVGDGAVRVNLIGQLAAATLASPGGLPTAPDPPQIAKRPEAGVPTAPPAGLAPPVAEAAPNDTVEHLEKQIAQLDDKLLAGEVSEATHGRMLARLESRLHKLLGE